MTPREATRKIHWHVRDADSVRPEPYSSPAAARCAMQIRGEPMPGFRVVKIGLRGACPCREASSVADGRNATSAVAADDPKFGKLLVEPRPKPEKRSAGNTAGCELKGPLAETSANEPCDYTARGVAPSVSDDRAGSRRRHGSVSSDRKVQTPRKEGEPNTKSTASSTLGMKQAGAATLSTSVNPTNPSVAPAQTSTGAGCAEATPSPPRALLASAPTTYGQAELSYLQRMSDGGIEG